MVSRGSSSSYLGAALHLAQDALIPSPRSWGSLHDYIERELARLTVPEGVIEESLGIVLSPLTHDFRYVIHEFLSIQTECLESVSDSIPYFKAYSKGYMSRLLPSHE